MVKFLLYRPIALTMSYIAVLVLGLVATTNLPVSLIPDMDIPIITVQVNAENTSARELESTIIKPLRSNLMQIAHLQDIQSSTRDGIGVIQLKLEFGTDIDYAFIDVNEKIDQGMSRFPKETPRPKALKASASDVPVFYLNLALKDIDGIFKKTVGETISQKFVELSGFAENVIKKRLEQQPSVAMVDMSGLVYQELLIIPDLNKLDALGLTLPDLEQQIQKMELELSNLIVKDAQYQYNIRTSHSLKNKKDIENIFLKIEDRLLQLKDLAKVVASPKSMEGMVTSNEENIVTLAIIKQSDAQMAELKEELHSLIKHFEKDYPIIEFTISRDQTALLDYSISNVKQSLVWGAFFTFTIMFFFLKDFKSPLLIGITIPTSLLISLLFFYLTGLSINIISLSGLVLGVGMMIDNSIIVIDNITQHYEKSGNLVQACIKGTNEVTRPMLSSILTTCAVFIPLIFISGIAGSLFYEQAISVTIGLFVSLLVSITLLPVYFKLLYQKKRTTVSNKSTFLNKFTWFSYANVYEKGLRFTLKNQSAVWLLFLAMLGFAGLLFTTVKKDSLPAISKTETILKIDWNEPIHIGENKKRVYEILKAVKPLYVEESSMVGTQQFILNKEAAVSASETQVYIKANNDISLGKLVQVLKKEISKRYPQAGFEFTDSENIFNLIFSGEAYPLIAKLRPVEFSENTNENLQTLLLKLHPIIYEYYVPKSTWTEFVTLRVDPVKLLLYDISPNTLYTKLKSAFGKHEITTIREGQHFVPVLFGGSAPSYKEIIATLEVANTNNKLIPVSNLLSETRGLDLKNIVAGKEGEYFPVNLQIPNEASEELMSMIRQVVNQDKNFEVSFDGEIFSNQELVKEFSVIMVISILLLYFILASQFESLTLPFIVLLEIPIDIFGVLLALYLFGESLNLMSLIGIIVMSGIIINDSILKIDTINQLRTKEGYPLMKALVVAGQRRLKPILMTSLTTVLALVPFLFTSGLGADLQKPMAIAIIGGMTIGTVVSLYFIPLFYFYLNRKGN